MEDLGDQFNFDHRRIVNSPVSFHDNKIYELV